MTAISQFLSAIRRAADRGAIRHDRQQRALLGSRDLPGCRAGCSPVMFRGASLVPPARHLPRARHCERHPAYPLALGGTPRIPAYRQSNCGRWRARTLHSYSPRGLVDGIPGRVFGAVGHTCLDLLVCAAGDAVLGLVVSPSVAHPPYLRQGGDGAILVDAGDSGAVVVDADLAVALDGIDQCSHGALLVVRSHPDRDYIIHHGYHDVNINMLAARGVVCAML